MVDSSEQSPRVPRYEVNAYVDFTGNEVLLFHRIQNISLGGVCIGPRESKRSGRWSIWC